MRILWSPTSSTWLSWTRATKMSKGSKQMNTNLNMALAYAQGRLSKFECWVLAAVLALLFSLLWLYCDVNRGWISRNRHFNLSGTWEERCGIFPVNSLQSLDLSCQHPIPISLPQTLVEYVWLGSSTSLRSKTAVLDFKPTCLEDLPVISAHGSYDQLVPEDEVFLRPRKIFNDPFRGHGNLLVLCDSFHAQVDAVVNGQVRSVQMPVLKPHPANLRTPCEDVLNRAGHAMAVFSVEQEYTVVPPGGPASHAWLSKTGNQSCPPGSAACHSGPQAPAIPFVSCMEDLRAPSYSMGRRLAERHLQSCLDAGIKMAEFSQRTTPDVWAYKLGLLGGMDMADQLWMSRFLMLRISEEEGIPVSFDPSAAGALSEGNHCTIEYSTAASRQPGAGLDILQQHIALLQAAHPQHALAYGKRGEFTVGMGNQAASVVVPTLTLLQQAGHLVDRRPVSNMDPYLAVMMLVSTTEGVPLPSQFYPFGPDERHSAHSDNDSRAWPPLQRAPKRCSSWAASVYSDDYSCMNSEDVLIDELDKIDGFGINAPRAYTAVGQGFVEEGWDEYCSAESLPCRH